MTEVASFISNYSESSRMQIDFAWNGKHSAEFADSNQEFRWEVARQCIASPDRASVLLLEHLFLADAEWAREARRPPEHFAQLGSTLLIRGEVTAVSPFLKGLVRSFDTLGSSHEIRLPAGLVVRLRQAAEENLSTANEEQQQALEDVLELFGKLETDPDSQGWLKVVPDAPSQNISDATPRVWYQRGWARFASLFGRGGTRTVD